MATTKYNLIFSFLVNNPVEAPLAVAIPLGPVASPASAVEEARVPEDTHQAVRPALSITYEKEGNEEDMAAEIRAIKGTFDLFFFKLLKVFFLALIRPF